MKMNKTEFISAISSLKRIQTTLNDIYIWSKIDVILLEEIEKKKEIFGTIPSFPVPSKIPNKAVPRKPRAIVEALRKARTTDLYKALVVYVVSLVEPVLMEIVRLTLIYDNRRIKTKPKGCEGKLEYDTIIDCNDYSEVVDVIIAKYIDALSYSKPGDQLEYIEKILSIEIDEQIWKEWIEIKASRDIIVHNSCIINKVYIEKAGDKSRGDLGKAIVIDEAYFSKVIVVSKSLIGKIVSAVTRKEKSSES